MIFFGKCITDKCITQKEIQAKKNHWFLFENRTHTTRSNTPSSYSCICIADFCEGRVKARVFIKLYSSCRATTIQVSLRATNGGIINITLSELRTQPRTSRVGIRACNGPRSQQESDA